MVRVHEQTPASWAHLGLLFDCDGVLVDSLETIEEAWGTLIREYDLPGDDVLAVLHGRPARRTVEDFVAPHLREEALARIDALELGLAHRARPLPGAAECLASARPGSWAVATSGGRDLTLAKLRAAGLPTPEVLVSADDVAHGKPDPEPYLTAAARLGRAIEECVVFEDSAAGIRSARSAGALVVGVGPAVRGLDVDHHVADLSQVRELLSPTRGTGRSVSR